MTAPDLPALRALAEAATPGPWWSGRDGRVWNDDWLIAKHAADEDAAFIAAANPTAVLALLDEVEALRATVERVEALAEATTLALAEEFSDWRCDSQHPEDGGTCAHCRSWGSDYAYAFTPLANLRAALEQR